MYDGDKLLTERVQALLRGDRDLNHYDIKALSRNGVVYLQGIVDVLAEKWRAGEILSNVEGVRRIENAISISTDGDINDEAVMFEVAEELNADPRVQLKNVQTRSHHGVVRLTGSVDTLAQAQAAVEAAAKSRGVKEVISEIRVKSEVDDATVTNWVEDAFRGERKLNPYLISTRTKGGHVYLHGTVNNRFMREFAQEVAANVPGVKKISNRLRLEKEPH